MRLVKAAKAFPHAKFYSLTTEYNAFHKYVFIENNIIAVTKGSADLCCRKKRLQDIAMLHSRLILLRLKVF